MEEMVFFREVAAATSVPVTVPSSGLPPAGVRGQLPRDSQGVEGTRMSSGDAKPGAGMP